MEQPSALHYVEQVLVSRLRLTDASFMELPQGTEQPRHVLPRPKLILVYEGVLVYRLGEEELQLRSGTMLFRPRLLPTSWYIGSSDTCRLCFVEYETFGIAEWPRPAWVTRCDLELELRTVKRLRTLACLVDPASRVEAEGETKAALCRFFSRAVEPTGEAVTHVRGRPAHTGLAAVRDAMLWLSHHLEMPDAVTGLAGRVGMSEDHFRRVFRREVGMSPQNYLLKLRVNTARAYLERSSLPVKEVARLVGYRDPLYFSRLYKRVMGRAPSEDRVEQPPDTTTA